jgi:predicted Holliday junction resolvase-like endonuclease
MKALAKRKSPSLTSIVVVCILVLLLWKLSNKIDKLETKVQYNKEKVQIERDSRGRIAALSVDRIVH